MVSLDCATQSDSGDMVNKDEVKSIMCTNGILPQFVTSTTEFSQSLPPNLTSNLKSLNYPSHGIHLEKSASLSHFSPIKSKQPQYNSCALLPSSKIPHKTNSRRSSSSSRSSQRIIPSSISSPPVKRNRSLPKVPGLRFILKDSLSYIKSTHFYNLNKKTTLRRCLSEPCIIYASKPKESYLGKRRYSERLNILTTKPIHLRTTTSPKKPSSKPIKNKIPSTNSQIINSQKMTTGKIPPKPAPNFGTISKNTPTKIPRSSLVKPTKKTESSASRAFMKRKIDQATQIELQTKEVESQTEFNEKVTDQSKKREKNRSSTANRKESAKKEPTKKEPKKEMKKTVVTPFSFMDSVQAWQERKEKRAKMGKKFEVKRWHRPAIILKKKPFKIILPIEQKTTKPKTISFETDVRRQKWEQYLKEFTERQEKLKKERQHRAQIEIRNYRKTLVPLIHKVPYKKLGIRPRKPMFSQFRKLREQSMMKDPNSWQVLRKIYPKENIVNKMKKNNRRNIKQKQNSSRLEKLNKIPEIEKTSNGKNTSKINNNNFSKTLTKEKMDWNVKNTRTSSVDIERNNRKKISSSNETESRRHNSALVKESSPGNAFTERGDYDGLYEKYNTSCLSSTDSNKRYKIVRVKTPRKVF